MGNSTEHFVAGAILAVIADLILQSKMNPNQPPNLAETAAWGFIGGTVALAPDILEPATGGTHRQFFHSIAGLALLGGLNQKVLASPTYTPEQKKGVLIASLAYSSHLLMDSRTPAGLPVV